MESYLQLGLAARGRPGRGRTALRRSALLAGSIALSLVTTLVAAAPLPAAAATTPAKSCPSSEADEFSATFAARTCGGRVLVAGDESPTTLIYALPNGEMQATTAMAPVRAKRADGTWAPVDLTLATNADGTVSPANSVFPLRLAKGSTAAGEQQLLSIGAGADAVGLDWTGPLPIPVLSGSVATYPDVKPGIDLVVTPTAAGVEQDIVIRNATGLANLDKLALPVTAKAEASYAATAGGGAIIKDKSGRVIANVPGMTDVGRRGRPDHQASGAARARRIVRQAGREGRSFAGAEYPAESRLDVAARAVAGVSDHAGPDDQPGVDDVRHLRAQGTSTDECGDNDLQFGTTSGNVTRSFLSWDMTSIEHATITSATVELLQLLLRVVHRGAVGRLLRRYAATTPTTYATQPAATTRRAYRRHEGLLVVV